MIDCTAGCTSYELLYVWVPLIDCTDGCTSYELLYVWVPLIELQQCNEAGNVGEVDETMACAEQTGKDSCQVCLVLL